jgi:hypothetical protein
MRIQTRKIKITIRRKTRRRRIIIIRIIQRMMNIIVVMRRTRRKTIIIIIIKQRIEVRMRKIRISRMLNMRGLRQTIRRNT